MSNSGLKRERKNVWTSVSDREKADIMQFAGEYKQFIDTAKTEREAVRAAVSMLEDAGFKDISRAGGDIAPGEKFYAVVRNKALMAFVAGSRPLTEGVNLIGAHIDSPRLDLKPRPVGEEEGLGIFRTHYYGGIKQYQWFAVPLALHGIVVREDGRAIPVVIGEDSSEPVFTVADLLPHLSREQMEKKLSEVFTGEDLRPLLASIPCNDGGEKPVKAAVLDILYHKYGITEEDLVSAELELVPAWPARDVGLDASMIGAYGHDDRVCAYAGLRAITGMQNPARTAVLLLADKEEIGSTGNTGMNSDLLGNVMAEYVYLATGNESNLNLRRVLSNSRALSADVNAALNPNFPDVMEKGNAARLGQGLCITKYTGSGGKKGANDSHAEFMGVVRGIFNNHNVIWQTGELGKVDRGGGGTIAYMLAEYGMDVVDCGIALLGMHSTMEIASKADIYMACRGYNAFFNS